MISASSSRITICAGLSLIAMNSSEQSVSQASGEDFAFTRCAEAVEMNAASSRQMT
jgi:hypothetical protein